MDLNQLRYFMTVVKYMSFTKASQELYLTRQALSQSIQALENYLETPLFERRNNRLALTPAGLLLAERAPEILVLADRTELEIRNQSSQFRNISLAYSESLSTFLFPLLPEILKEFDASHQNMPLQAVVSGNDEIWEMIKGDHATFGLMVLMPWETDEYSFVPLWNMKLGISLAFDHPLARQESLALNDLRGEHIIGMGNPETSYHGLAKALSREGIPFAPEIIVDPIEAFYHVKKHHYLLLDYADFPDYHFPGIRVLPLSGMQSQICLVYKKSHTLSPAEAFFIQYIKSFLRAHPLGPIHGI